MWWDYELDRISTAQRAAIADSGNQVFVSPVTAWELGIKRAKGKLNFTGSISERIVRFGFSDLPITTAHAEEAAGLPSIYGDPFDRMLVAQARVEGLTLVTADAAIRGYAVSCL
jgi:PIN domain nuclease of toxin-antitoxin system